MNVHYVSERVSHKAVLFLLVVFSLAFSSALAQDFQIPENPLKGRFVFEHKGCINCHSIKGAGGDVGPDLGQRKFYGTFLELAAIMLNHAPEMLRRMRELDLPYAEFSSTEMVELVAYLYYLRYLGEPGDLYRGRVLVKEKGCTACHSIAGKGGTQAPAFDKLAKYVSPLYMAQALWNHGPEMEKEIARMGLERPKFEKGEIVDLSAYIRAASKGTVTEQVYMSPGNPQRGQIVFKQKGCFDCHSSKGDAPDFEVLEWDYSVTEIAGLMWNHGFEMAAMMQEQNMSWPMLSSKEMADLISYLYFLRFTDKPGDSKAGQEVFTTKGCVQCHGADAEGGDYAPDLSKSEVLVSVINMAQIMWNHTPVMEERIAEKILRWPEFDGPEMRDLYAYLSTLSTKKMK